MNVDVFPYSHPHPSSDQYDWIRPNLRGEQHAQVMNFWLASAQGTMGELKGCGGQYPGNGEGGGGRESKDIC